MNIEIKRIKIILKFCAFFSIEQYFSKTVINEHYNLKVKPASEV